MADNASPDPLSNSAATQLKTVVERIERINVDLETVKGDLKEIFAEAKGNGFDVKILRRVIRLRKMDKAKRQEEDAITELYLSALGGL